MNENIKIFLQKVSEEKTLQAKLQACKGPDDAYEFAASIQSGFTKEEFQSTMKELKANMSRDLSDEDLEKAAGGGINDITATTGSIVTTMSPVTSMAASEA
jgi:predicted ribosomally synthesized peptide with nif11-like leader